jgi:hypothetical protein
MLELQFQSLLGLSKFCFMLEMTSVVVNNLQELGEFLNHWAPYKFLWKNSEQNKREMLNASLNEFESWLRRHCELESHLTTEPDQHVFGSCLVVSTGEDWKLYISSVIWFSSNKLPVCHL